MQIKYIKIIILILICFYSTILYAQKCSRKDSLNILQIENTELLKILDSVLFYEKECNYYSSDLLFEINILSTKDSSCYEVQIESFGIRKYNIDRDIGVFLYKEHKFFINGEALPKTLFNKTNKKMHIKLDKQIKGVISVFEDDSFPIWIYYYKDKKFIFNLHYNPCK